MDSQHQKHNIALLLKSLMVAKLRGSPRFLKVTDWKSPAYFCPSESHRSELGADAGDHFITTPSHTPLAHQPLVGSGRAAPERRDARAVVESAAAAAAAAGRSSGAPPARVRARAVLRGGSV